MASKYKTKPGPHGTLYLFEIEFTDPDPGVPPHMLKSRLWAYSTEHAIERWTENLLDSGYDDPDSFYSPRIKTVKKVKV